MMQGYTETEPMTSEGLRLKAIIDATPECIKIVAPDGSLTYMNKAGLDMVEAGSFSQVDRACIFDVIASTHRSRWIEMHRRVCKGERPDWQFEIVGLNGTRRFMETHAVPLPNPDGSFSQLAVTRDITERKKAELALKRNDIVLRGQKKALELALNGAGLSEILNVLTQTAEKQADVKVFASILLLDAGQARLLHGSGPSLPKEYNDAIHGISIGPDVGSCGTAAYTKREVIVRDIATDKLWVTSKTWP